jgi:lycopene cyclase domain-containing protein
MEHYTYLLVISGGVLVPVLFSFHPRLRFWSNIRVFLKANLITASLFILWDACFTYLHIWGFNPRYVTGIYFFQLPLEEVLFFIFIPYACLFSYHCFGTWKGEAFEKFKTGWLTAVLSALLLILAVVFQKRAYTAVTFILLADFLIFLEFVYKPKWLTRFYFTYLVMLIPFFIINGILTGTGLAQPVVWYNNEEIINLRILTIPVEDIFYGMLLTGLNVFFYEMFLDRKHSLKSADPVALTSSAAKLRGEKKDLQTL